MAAFQYQKKMSHKTWHIVFKLHQLSGILLVTLVAITLYLRRDINWEIVREPNIITLKSEQTLHYDNSSQNCDYFSGKWVYDNVSYPLYTEKQCSFIFRNYITEFACEKYGRKDMNYQRLRWQPDRCDISRFNGTALLEKIRGKKVAFVGDSLNRNQFISMLCLIESSLPPSSDKSLTVKGNFYYFHDNVYNTTIGFYWSPFLVESNSDDIWRHRVQGRVARIKYIEAHARHWNDADILIFNSFAWWMSPTTKILFGSFNDSDAIYKIIEKPRHYEMAINTLSDWLEINLDQTKTRVFFMGSSPYPNRGDALRQCYNKTEPIPKEGFSIASNRQMIHIQASAMQMLKTRGVKAEYLPITEMSELRRDGHPSIYKNFDFVITEENLKDPKTYADCLHWCLPGVPDTWNQILYAYIMYS